MTMRGESIQLTATPVFETSGTRPNLKDDLLVVGRALGTRWKLILSIVLMALVGGIAVMWIATPTYRSSVDILVDPRARTLVGMDVVPAGLGSSSYGSDTALVDSQLQLVQSRAVLAAVVTKLGLDAAAPLLCAGIIGFRCLHLSGIQPGGRLGLYGFGAAAHVAMQVARHWGVEVYAMTRDERHRNLAMELGAAWAGDTFDMPPMLLHAAIVFHLPAGQF